MNVGAFHLMQAVLDEERETMRYTCLQCDRCIEDGPEGLRVVHSGDSDAVHRGGQLAAVDVEIEAQPPTPPPVLH